MSQENFEYGSPSMADADNDAGVVMDVDQPTAISGSQVFPGQGGTTSAALPADRPYEAIYASKPDLPHADSYASRSAGHAPLGAAGAQLPPSDRAGAGLGSSAYSSDYGLEKGDQ